MSLRDVSRKPEHSDGLALILDRLYQSYRGLQYDTQVFARMLHDTVRLVLNFV